MIAAIVCEGPTDFPILEKLIRRLVPSIQKVIRLHPEVDQLTMRLMKDTVSGWTGVQKWCQDIKGNLDDYLNKSVTSMPIVLLVLHVDADVMDNERYPCPPPSNATNALRERISGWLGGKVPGSMVFATPSKSIETWILAVHRPRTPNIECDPQPAESLAQLGILRRDSKGVPDKDTRVFRQLADNVAERVKSLRKTCTEANRFCKDIETLFGE